MFEAIPYAELANISDNKTRVYNELLNDRVADVEWYEMRNTGDSMYKEMTHHFVGCPVTTRRSIDLNTLIDQKGILGDARNILIKIDCQGAEIPILRGASSIMSRTDFIILEMPLFGQYNAGVASFSEHIQYMESIGFVVYDILDPHYINGFNMQVDVLFINKNHEFNTQVNMLLM